ncbi:hypothetical protein OG211_13745 [Streptomyces niveus]|uniref:Integral membrane protein n=1 Tax=Streptomyces niveus TaxID=193462 RepID=A0ABZ2A8M4_STRNV|nr:hypothetical protein [Streptomyces niveus]WTA59454.1 hypothetical protein OG211_13745 [Streptomyces niveus]
MKPSSSQLALSVGRRVAMACVAALLLAAGFWTSWGTAQHVLLSKGREHGTLSVTECGDTACTGTYDPEGPVGPRAGAPIERSVAVKKGRDYEVVLKPGTGELVRAGSSGALLAWVPLGGALLLAAPVVGGGLRMTRTAWATALAGAALLAGAFFAL